MRGTLLIGSLPRIVIPVARQLAARGIPVHAACVGRGSNFHSRSLRSRTLLPDDAARPAAFFASLTKLIDAKEIDTIMPCGDECLRALAPFDREIRALVHYCAPAAPSVRKILYKPDALDIAKTAGIPIPREYRIPNMEMLDAMRSEITFPLIMKPRSHEGEAATGIKCQPIHSFGDLRYCFQRYPGFSDWFLIQEFIPGYGVAVNVLMHDGTPIAVMQHRRLREYPVRGGVSVSAECEAVDPEILGHSLALLRALEWEGVAMVEFRKDPESGRLGLMEVNGRFWGSISLAFHSGVDFPWYLWQIAHGQQPTPAIPPTGTRFRWLGGDLRRIWECLSSNERYGWHVAAQAFGDRPGVKDSIWSWSDPIPGIQDFVLSAGVVSLKAAEFAARSLLPPSTVQRLRTLVQDRLHWNR